MVVLIVGVLAFWIYAAAWFSNDSGMPFIQAFVGIPIVLWLMGVIIKLWEEFW